MYRAFIAQTLEVGLPLLLLVQEGIADIDVFKFEAIDIGDRLLDKLVKRFGLQYRMLDGLKGLDAFDQKGYRDIGRDRLDHKVGSFLNGGYIFVQFGKGRRRFVEGGFQ